MNKSLVAQEIIESGIVAIIRSKDSDKVLRIVAALLSGGIRAIEITLSVAGALKLVEDSVKEFGNDILIGTGSVVSKDDAVNAVNAGARYLVSPILKIDIIEIAHRNEVAAIPGAFSPSEIQKAFEAGADIVKVFPADVLGLQFIKDIKAPLPHLNLMPTGGITTDNICKWFDAGACSVGIGSALLDPVAIKNDDYRKLAENAGRFVDIIKEYKNKVN